MYSTLTFNWKSSSNWHSTNRSAEKYTKSSTYKPRYSGGLPGMRVPEKIHGSFGSGCSPTSQSFAATNLDQCDGLWHNPFKVFQSFQYVSGWEKGHPDGDLTITSLSSGRMGWQNAFLHLINKYILRYLYIFTNNI